MKLKFIGATESVTGSKHLLLTNKGTQILLDCGLYQGMGKETDALNRHLGFDPANIEAVILSHAHIDHSGALPLLVKQGFTGKIYCTEATYDVCEILLNDSANIHESDAHYINKNRKRRGLPPIKPLYGVKDAVRCLKHFKPIPYHAEFYLNDEVSFHFSDVGHITGSAAVHLTLKDNDRKEVLSFTGDVGRYTDLLLKAPEPFLQSDYIICESTYGDRLHEGADDAGEKLLRIVKETCVEKGGRLIIPAFSLGRTQEIVFVLDKLKNEGKLPEIKTFVDSPLSVNATEIVRKHPESFNAHLQAYIKTDPDPFGFNNLVYIQDANLSKELNDLKEPCIIISASGMADAGRVKHHIRNAVGNPNNTILLVGYCAPGTLGARLLEGQKRVHIFGDYFDVNCRVDAIHSYSAHADYNELLRYLSCQEATRVKRVFLVHGETEPKAAFKLKLNTEGYKDVVIPAKGETFKLDI